MLSVGAVTISAECEQELPPVLTGICEDGREGGVGVEPTLLAAVVGRDHPAQRVLAPARWLAARFGFQPTSPVPA